VRDATFACPDLTTFCRLDRLHILDQHGTTLTVVPRTNTKEVTRYKAYGHTTGRRA
jgi:hypothetical protein